MRRRVHSDVSEWAAAIAVRASSRPARSYSAADSGGSLSRSACFPPLDLVLARQEQRGDAAVCLRDDPDPRALADAVAGQDSEAVLHREIVFFRVLGRHIAPVAALVPLQQPPARNTRLLQGGERPGRRDGLPQWKKNAS